MIDFRNSLSRAGRTLVTEVPEGFDAWILAMVAATRSGAVLHVARDEGRMAAIVQALGFFAPDLEVLSFPAWDCLPYDRVSPNPVVLSRRMNCLHRLATASDMASLRFVVVTTVSAIGQRIPPRDVLAGSGLRTAVGERIDLDGIIAYLARNGYGRSATVREPGEFAVRGGLIDIFPPGTEFPFRLDLFGDVLEGIRRFDPLTQRSTGGQETLSLIPIDEVLLDEASIHRFRGGYRSHFGAVTDADPLYAAVTEGRKHMGMEHWLPLFHDRLETLLDYVGDCVITLDHLVEEAWDSRQAMVREYYETRRNVLKGQQVKGVEPYKPIPPELLYVDREEWSERIQNRAVAQFSPFKAPEKDGDGDGDGKAIKVISAGGRKGRDFAPERSQPDVNVYDSVREHITALQGQGKRVVMASYSEGALDRLSHVLRDHGVQMLAVAPTWPEVGRLPASTVALSVLGLESGFETDEVAIIGEQDILGDRLVRPRHRTRRAESFIAEASMLSPGDLVVHVDHGIGRFESLKTLDIAGAPHDCVLVVYEGGDKLYIPVENIEVLSRYGAGDSSVSLDRLGGSAWQARKAGLKKRIREMAEELIAIAATRQLRRGDVLTPPEGLYEEFCARFPYHETEDQLRAIEDTISDLASGRPMDRLICGDVGFGKTEVALRSTFVTAMDGRQVAVITPTTLLCRQHYKTFRERFAGLPVNIAQLSRLVTARDQSLIKEELKAGQVDIVIGTHALLGKAVEFRDLGLVIVDEEQHFGVAHKERLKQLRSNVHVLTLTATPIPRTLQLALTGLRELSLIATPPVDRLAVRTFVLPFDPVPVREALLREHYRGGQSFYVCPRIADLEDVQSFLRDHVPEVKFATAHGRMAPSELEDVMVAFYDGAYDVLVSTNIIESGLDIPTANTLIIHRADMFGLAQLYQLRGRIGRSKIRGYAYFTLPGGRMLTEAAYKRLEVLQALDTLGAGFSLASYDLDIRGAGNLLGEEQSGHIREVGFELYQEMLEEAVAAARGDIAEEEAKWSPQISIGTAVLIPESYVADLSVRMDLYRRLSRLEEQQEIESLAAELIDRFGPLPQEVEYLLKIVAIKRYCRQANVEKLEAGPRGATLGFRGDSFPNPAGMVAFLSRQVGTAKLRPDHRLVYMRTWETPADRLDGVLHLLKSLGEIAAAGTAAESSRSVR